MFHSDKSQTLSSFLSVSYCSTIWETKNVLILLFIRQKGRMVMYSQVTKADNAVLTDLLFEAQPQAIVAIILGLNDDN